MPCARLAAKAARYTFPPAGPHRHLSRTQPDRRRPAQQCRLLMYRPPPQGHRRRTRRDLHTTRPQTLPGHGTRITQGPGKLLAGHRSRATATVILTEGAIDAQSIHALDIAGCRKPGTLIASTSGVTVKLPDWIRCLNPQRILCAWDGDTIGDEAARRLQNSQANIERLRPDGAKDWNDILKMRA